ncbi:hypothetical protein, partial [uncultured Dialister sp.]|uniref:hypothetical protein n=1 Tax=uncultured Dialister sp. TaxID=278064 RepID=UPI00260E5025
RQAATTFGPEGRQPSPLNSLNLHARKGVSGAATPFEPYEPYEPFEPGPQSGPYFLLFLYFSLKIML